MWYRTRLPIIIFDKSARRTRLHVEIHIKAKQTKKQNKRKRKQKQNQNKTGQDKTNKTKNCLNLMYITKLPLPKIRST